MESSPLLSIITPVYQGDVYLASCIQNVANQWMPGIEHLVIDGGSTDTTVAILEASSAQYPHLRWISEKDRGQSDAMNKGIRMAKGMWIGFLNVDDFYEPVVLPGILKLIQKPENEGSILVGNLNIWNADDSLHMVNKPGHMHLALLLADICEWPFNPSAYFYPKSIHEKIGFFPENEHYAMDYDFILKAFLANIRFKYFNEMWGNFRLLPEAKTSTDQASNTSFTRALRLREAARNQLSAFQRLEVTVLIGLWKVRNKLWSMLRLTRS